MNYLFNLFLGEEAFLLSEKKKKGKKKNVFKINQYITLNYIYKIFSCLLQWKKYNIFIRHTYKSLSKRLQEFVVNIIYIYTEQTIVAILIFFIISKMTVTSKILFKSEMHTFPRHIYAIIIPNQDNIPVFLHWLSWMDFFPSRITWFWDIAWNKVATY